MSYIKWFVFTLIFSLAVGFSLAYLQQGKEYETTVEIKSSETKEHLSTYSLNTFPKVKSKYNQNLTGQGKTVFESELYSPIFVRVKAPGYKTKYGFYLWKASDENVILLEPIAEQKEKEKTPHSSDEEPTKVDMLPTFK